MTTEELIERGLPTYMNELGDWQKTDMVQTVGHRLAKVAGIWTAVPVTNSNNTNFSEWIKGLTRNFQSTLGPVNNDTSRTIGREGLAIHVYFDADGNVTHANMIGVATLQMLVSKYPTAPADVMQKAATVRYEFTQKPDLQLTSILPDLNFDGISLVNNTIIDGLPYTQHPNIPAVHSWVLDIANFDDRMTGKTSRLHYKVIDNEVTLVINRANGQSETIENVFTSFVHSWTIAETDDAELLNEVYDAVNNIIWVDFSKNVVEAAIMYSNDLNLKAESSQSAILSLK